MTDEKLKAAIEDLEYQAAKNQREEKRPLEVGYRETLNDVLAQLNLTHRRGRLQYTKDILRDGEVLVGGIIAIECWRWLRSEGLIR